MGRGGDNHPGGLLTDSIMLISIDSNKEAIAMLSIPRDLLVPIENHGEDKINSAFTSGYNDYMSKDCESKNKRDCRDKALSAGANLTRKSISEITGLEIQYYVMADFEGFEKAVDKIDGIDINVKKDLYDPLYPDEKMEGYNPFFIKAGQHQMDGATALKYVRSRQTSSDFARSERQQQVITAIKEKTFKLGFLSNPKKIIDLISILSHHLRTDLSPADINALASLINDSENNKIISKVLSNDSDGPLASDSSNGTYYLTTKTGDFDQIKNIAQNIFSEEESVIENAKIEVLNGTNTTGRAGKLAELLQELDYQIVKIDNSNENYEKSIIINYSKDANKKTLEFIKKGLRAEVIEKSDKPSSGADISVIIGDDYRGFVSE